MMRRFLAWLSVSLLVSSLVLAQSESNVSSSPAEKFAFGEKLHLPGVSNAGKISDVLYRGAQPRGNGLPELKKLGITTIVDLRGEDADRVAWERERAESLGIRFVHIPVSGWKPPTDKQVAEFLALFREDPRQKIFVHCRFGDDRTGVFVATYRMALEKWPSDRTMKEMYYFGFNGFWHPSMKAYIRNFPSHMSSTPELSSFRPPSAGP